MKETGKRTLSLLVSILLLVTILPQLRLPAAADVSYAAEPVIAEDTCSYDRATHPASRSLSVLYGGSCGSNVTWQLDVTGTLTISGNGAMYGYGLKDSNTIWDGEPAPWYEYRQQINHVIFLSGVTNIGGFAFNDCSSLTSVTIPDSVTRIGEFAFNDCSSLTSVTIPDSITSLGSYVFYGCRSLTSVTVPEGITKIPAYAFYSCRNLTSVTIPESVTYIDNDAFGWCFSLTSITIPEGVTRIGSGVFMRCTNLSSITIPDGITRIEDYLFDYCTSLETVNIPDGVTYIGSAAFSGCSIASVTIPAGVTSIGEYAFSNCTNLSSITFCGAAPNINSASFKYVTATVYYPCGYESWSEKLKNYSGTLSWELRHSGEDNVTIQEATCDRDKTITETCQGCGSAKITVIPDTAFGHSFETTVTPPTCTDAGCTTDTCTTCGYNAVIEIPATGHTYDANGQCVDCGIQFQLIIFMTDTYGDSWNGSTIEVYTDDTLLTTISLPKGQLSGEAEVPYVPGKTYSLKWKSSSCDNECGFKITLNEEMLASGQGSSFSDGELLCTFKNACAHAYQPSETIVTPPTCTEEGFTTGTCTACGYSGIIETTPATGHSFETIVTPPTCTEEGFTTGTCTICGHSGVIRTTPATGHSFETIVTPPTCTEEGFTANTCMYCGFCNTKDTIPATGHSFETSITSPTCTVPGVKTDTCTACGSIQEETIPVTAHDYQITVVPRSCTGYGYEFHQCQSCGNCFYNHVTLPTGHHYENGICSRCGDAEPRSVPGDINGDGTCNIADVAKLYAHCKGSSLLDSTSQSYADINGDGRLNIADTARLYSHVKGTDPLN